MRANTGMLKMPIATMRGEEPRPVDRAQHDRREQRREGEGEVATSASPPPRPSRAAPTASRPSATPSDEADADRDHADQDRVARAHQQQRGDVAAEAVGAQPVRGARAACSLLRRCRSRPPATASRPATAAAATSSSSDSAPPSTKLGWRSARAPKRSPEAAGAAPTAAAHAVGCAFRRGSITTYSTSTTKLTTTTIAASSMHHVAHHHQVAVGDGLEHQPADARQHEHVLDHDRAADQVARTAGP